MKPLNFIILLSALNTIILPQNTVDDEFSSTITVDNHLNSSDDNEKSNANQVDIRIYEIEAEASTPAEFVLSQNYPNPFNPVTTIKFQMPKAGKVSLKIYDTLGDVVITLIDEYKKSGIYQVKFHASSLASGIYFYRLSASEFVDVKKMVLIK